MHDGADTVVVNGGVCLLTGTTLTCALHAVTERERERERERLRLRWFIVYKYLRLFNNFSAYSRIYIYDE